MPVTLSFSAALSFFPKNPPSKSNLHRPSIVPIPILCKSSSTSTSSGGGSVSTAAAAPSFDLRSYWTALISQIESSLDAAIPVRYPERIYEAIRHSVLSPSAKRAPPVMCVAPACDLLRLPLAAALPTACALEMVHAASLVHDDLPSMDDSPRRHGRPSTHTLFGVDMAVLAGDALFPLAFHHIATRTPPDLVPSARLLRVVAEMARAVGSTGMAAGQFLDLTSEMTDYVMEKKFGEMAECSAVCGAILGGADEEEVEGLRRYGRAVGVLYEVVNDILEDEEEEGFQNNNPNKNNNKKKKSYVKVFGKERAREVVEELRKKAKKELEGFERRYGEQRVLPLHSFVYYAVERGFDVK